MSALFDTNWGHGGLVVAELVTVGTILYLGRTSQLLRDVVPDEPDFTKRPYSMARTQFAFWLSIVLGCFIYLYFIGCDFGGIINDTALILLGLSTVTTAAAQIVKPAESQGATGDGAKVTPAPVHEDFLNDILSDNIGINLHRLQMFLWTVVFGVVFVHQVVKEGKFPDYDRQIYLLMGIGPATYVWFKKGEK